MTDHDRENDATSAAQSNVGKAFEIIRSVTAGPERSATVAEIAARLSLPRPTANRIVGNLIKLGLLKRDGGGTRLIEGDRLVEIAGAALEGAALRGPRHDVLRQLVIDTRETANVGTLSGAELVYLDRVEAVWPLAFRLEVGSRVPAYCSAIGKLLLARMPERKRKSYLDAMTLTRRTDTTICDPAALGAELDHIHETGVAIDNQECFSGIIAIAVQVGTDHLKPPMGVALVAPSGRQTVENFYDFLPVMRDAAARLARCYEG